MSERISGNLKGLAPSELRSLKRLANRRIDPEEAISLDVGRELYRLASSLSRRVGLLVDREGKVLEVVVGSREVLYLPDLGRYRAGGGRLRRIRLIFSDLSRGEDRVVIPQDIFADLEKLRLDAVIGVKDSSNKLLVSLAYLTPSRSSGSDLWHTEIVPMTDLSKLDFHFAERIRESEEGIAEEQTRKVTHKGTVALVGVYGRKRTDAEESMAELTELARTAGLHVVDTITQHRDPDPKTFLGKGKLEELMLRCLRSGAELIVFDAELRPSQWRAITNTTELKVIDRSMLILDIFASRALSADGRLQVELAQLKYNLPKLVEKDAGLSRLTGGIGGRGPGETKLEIGRRRIRERIADLEKRIDSLAGQRALRRQRRTELPLPLISIVGYTNVGKSTLFNALTGSKVIAENKLFATLDTTQRRLAIPDPSSPSGYTSVVVSDTVGFIRDLPDELSNAFRATLEELHSASLLLHVIDASHHRVEEPMKSVSDILQKFDLGEIPVLIVANKADKVDSARGQQLVTDFDAVIVSALTGDGLTQLRERIANRLGLLSSSEGPDHSVLRS